MRNALLGILAVALAGSATAAPRGPSSAASSQLTARLEAIRISYRVDPDSAERAEALADRIVDGTISGRDLREPKNAKLFLHLAAGAREPKVVAAALDGLSRTWSREGRGARPKVDKDFRAVVEGRLADGAGPVRAGALSAARLIIGGQKTDAKMLAQVVKIAGAKSGPDRVAAMEALFNVRDFQIPKAWPGNVKAQIIAAHLPNLDHDDLAVVVVALKNLARAAYPAMPENAKLQAKARALATHARPEVRGEAVQLLANLATGADLDKGDRALLIAALADPHPFVRAAAAMACGSTGDLALAHGLMGLMADDGAAKLVLTGFKTLDGEPGQVRLPTHAERVDETALESLKVLTAKSKFKFDYDSLGGKGRQALRAKAVAGARAWYAENEKKLPKAPAAPAPAAEGAPAAP